VERDGLLEQRRSRRVNLRIRIGNLSGAPVAMALTRNISVDGVLLDVTFSDPNWVATIGDVLELRFSLPEVSDCIESTVVVARIERDDSQVVRALGLEFRDLEERHRMMIEEFVAPSFRDS
jgi:hypothetical protein